MRHLRSKIPTFSFPQRLCTSKEAGNGRPTQPMRQCVSGKCPSRWQTCIKPFASKTEVDEAIGLWNTSVSFQFTAVRLGLFPSKCAACFVSASHRERWICRWNCHFSSDFIRCVQKGSFKPTCAFGIAYIAGERSCFPDGHKVGVLLHGLRSFHSF